VWRNVRLIFSKEIKDTLRDRRTLFIMILLPILLYPVLIITVTQLVSYQTLALRSELYKIKIWNAEEAPRFIELLGKYAAGEKNPNPDPDDKKKTRAAPRPFRRLEIIRASAAEIDTSSFLIENEKPETENGSETDQDAGGDSPLWIETKQTARAGAAGLKAMDLVRQGIDSREFYAGLYIRRDFEAVLDNGGNAVLNIIYDSTNERSKEAGRRLREFAQEWYIAPMQRERQKKVLAKAGMNEHDLSYFEPVETPKRDLAGSREQVRYFMAMILPMMLITMVLTGAFYPAIDLSAGEKERGTMETLLVSPASRIEIVLGKYFTVCLIALVTALLNILSLGLTVIFLASSLIPQGAASGPMTTIISAGTILSMFIVMLPLAALFSAMTLAISSFARSFKEGQNYLTPFIILVTLPAMASMIPGVHLTSATCFVPVFNTSLLFKSLLMQKFEFSHVFLVFGANALYAAMAIRWTVRLFQREEILFRSADDVSLRFWRARPKPGGLPTGAQALVLFFIVVTLQILIGYYAQAKNIFVGLPVTLIGIVGGSAFLFAAWGRFDVRRLFRFHAPRISHILIALAIAVCGFVIAQEIAFLQRLLSPSATESMRMLEKQMLEKMRPLLEHWWLAILYMALLPGIFEELLFRGPLLRGLEPGRKKWQAAVLCGILFGIMHLDFARAIPTGALGVALAFLVIRSGSIFPAMIAHFAYNGTLVGLVFTADALPENQAKNFESLMETSCHIAALPCLAAVVLLLYLTRKPRAVTDTSLKNDNIS